jgi:hypothetical protein
LGVDFMELAPTDFDALDRREISGNLLKAIVPQ